jgi:hypothetical protein
MQFCNISSSCTSCLHLLYFAAATCHLASTKENASTKGRGTKEERDKEEIMSPNCGCSALYNLGAKYREGGEKTAFVILLYLSRSVCTFAFNVGEEVPN